MDIGYFLIAVVTPCLIISSGEALHIKQCEHGITIKNNQQTEIRCEQIHPDEDVTWKIEVLGIGRQLATCESGGTTCTVHDTADNVYRESNFVALLLFGKWTLQNSTLTCEAKRTSDPVPRKLSCSINVIDAQKTTTKTSSKTEVTTKAVSETSLKPEGSEHGQSSDNRSKDSSGGEVPIDAIAGGVVAALVVVIVAIVVVIIIHRRKRREKHRAAADSRENTEVESRNNPANGNVDNSDDPNVQYDAESPEVGIYAFPGGDEPATIPDNTPAAEEDDVGMYAAPKQDVYAAVDKSKPKKNKPAASDHLDTSQAAAVTDEYAVVNKASKKKEASNSSGLSEVHIPENNDVTAAPVPYIYAQVEKTSKPAKTVVSVPRTPDEEGATYA